MFDRVLYFQEERIIDFDKIDEHAEAFAGCHVGYGCLGAYASPFASKENKVQPSASCCDTCVIWYFRLVLFTFRTGS